MQLFKKSIAFLMIFSFLSSVKIFTFGGFWPGRKQTPVDIAVFVAQDDPEVDLANDFLSDLCEAKKDRREKYGPFEGGVPWEYNFFRYKYGECKEFDLNFDLEQGILEKNPNGGFSIRNDLHLMDFLGHRPLALVLIDSTAEDIKWKEWMEDYLQLIAEWNKNASIIYVPIKVDELIYNVGLEGGRLKLVNMAKYVSSRLEPKLFRIREEQGEQKEQVISVIPATNEYIETGEILKHICDKLRVLDERGRLTDSLWPKKSTRVNSSNPTREHYTNGGPVPQEGQVVLYTQEQNSSQPIREEHEKSFDKLCHWCLLL